MIAIGKFIEEKRLPEDEVRENKGEFLHRYRISVWGDENVRQCWLDIVNVLNATKFTFKNG